MLLVLCSLGHVLSKTGLCLKLMRILDAPVVVSTGTVHFATQDILSKLPCVFQIHIEDQKSATS